MNGETLWDTIITALSPAGEEIQTKTGRWFKVTYRNGKLYVDNASDNKPSSELINPRTISQKEFMEISNYYYRWVSGEKGIRQKILKISQNITYIFALINTFVN